MKKVRTVEEMKAERARLKILRSTLEADIEAGIEQIKGIFSSVNAGKKSLGYIVHKPKDKDLLSATAAAITEVLMKKVILKNSGFFKRWIIGRGAANLTGNLVERNKGTIYEKLSQLLKHFAGRKTGSENLEQG